MEVGRTNHTATLLADSRLLVVGGERGAGTSVEIWDPATEMFGPGPALSEPRQYHTATRLPDGRVLIVGGGVDVWSSTPRHSRA